jgi:mRNA-degrading endonuclease toxin of MazEF toxin-antitoxin module
MLRGEVWWVNFDPSLGGEMQKTRPATVSKQRLKSKVGTLTDGDIRAVERAIRVQLGL